MGDTPRLYDDLAYLWPLLSPPEHYVAEADALCGLIAAHFGQSAPSRRRTLLELGAGGGHTLCHLTDTFDCTAADLSEPMLANCRKLIPGVQTVVGDMRSMRLGRTFDVVLLHDAIDYMTSAADARAACATIAAHLSPGGIAFVAPTYTRETFIDGEVADDGTTNRDPEDGPPAADPVTGDELTYFTFVHDADPADEVFEMILLYLIRDGRTRQVRVVEDRHTCGLFATEDWIGFLADAGLRAQHIEDDVGWSLFAARWQ